MTSVDNSRVTRKTRSCSQPLSAIGWQGDMHPCFWEMLLLSDWAEAPALSPWAPALVSPVPVLTAQALSHG